MNERITADSVPSERLQKNRAGGVEMLDFAMTDMIYFCIKTFGQEGLIMGKEKGHQGKVAGISSEAVEAKTGKGWNEWFTLLEVAGAREMKHQAIANYLYETHGLDGWWAQMVTVGYEQAHGLRDKNQQANGYTASVSRVLYAPLDRVYSAWTDENTREKWLLETQLIVRKATPNKSMRIAWDDGTRVSVEFYEKGEAKCQVVVQHSKLPDAGAVESMKLFWSEAFGRLKGMLG